MSSSTTPSIHAAIQQLQAEIIAQDWQLSAQRIIRLMAAFASLRSFFKDRPHALALLKMASSVVDHVEHQGPQANALDFLKEDMAHIVSLYEDDEHDADSEKETVRRVYKRFLRLNIRLTKNGLQAASQPHHAATLLDTLKTLSEQADQLPALLEQSGPLSPKEGRQAAALLGKISTAINGCLVFVDKD